MSAVNTAGATAQPFTRRNMDILQRLLDFVEAAR